MEAEQRESSSRLSQLGSDDQNLLRALFQAEIRFSGTNPADVDFPERRAAALGLLDRASTAERPQLVVRARNLAAVLRADCRQDFGPLAGIRAREPAFVVPLAHAATEGRALPADALSTWATALRPGIPSAAWAAASEELCELAALRCPNLVPRAGEGDFSVEYVPLAPGLKPIVMRTAHVRQPALRPPRELLDAVAVAERDLDLYAKSVEDLDRHDFEGRLARLPRELFEKRMSTTRGRLVADRIADLGTRDFGTVRQLVATVFPDQEPTFPRIVLASELLERCGVGFEPDPRFLAPLATLDVVAEVFPWDIARPRPSSAFVAAVALVQISAAFAYEDGHLDESERAQLEREVANAPGLEPAERARLRIRMNRLLAEPPDLSAILARLRDLGGPERAVVGEVLVRIAAADGRITEDEYDLLLRAFRAMRLNKPRLDQALRDGAPDARVDVALAHPPGGDRRSEMGKVRDEQRYNVLTTLLLGADAAAVQS